ASARQTDAAELLRPLRPVPDRRKFWRDRWYRRDAPAKSHPPGPGPRSLPDRVAARASEGLADGIGQWIVRARRVRRRHDLGWRKAHPRRAAFQTRQPVPVEVRRPHLGRDDASEQDLHLQQRPMAEPLIIEGRLTVDPSFPDGGLPPAPGVQSYQVFRASKA